MLKSIIFVTLAMLALASLGCTDYEDARAERERVQALIAETEALARESMRYDEEAANALEEQARQAPSGNPDM